MLGATAVLQALVFALSSSVATCGPVDEAERLVHLGGGDVTDRRPDRRRVRLLAQLGDHRLGDVDAVHPHPSLGERHRDPAGPDPELQRVAVARERGEEADRRTEDGRIEHVRRAGVVPGRDGFVEVDLSHPPTVAASATGGSKISSRSAQPRSSSRSTRRNSLPVSL